MEFLGATSRNHLLASTNPFWDGHLLQDRMLLLESSAFALRDFLFARGRLFEYAAVELRTAMENRAYSVQEQIRDILLGQITVQGTGVQQIYSIFELIEFADIELPTTSEVSCKFFENLDFSACTKYDTESETGKAFDIQMARQLMALRKAEVLNSGAIKDVNAEQQLAKRAPANPAAPATVVSGTAPAALPPL